MDNDGKLLELLRNTYKGLRFRLKYRGIRVLDAADGTVIIPMQSHCESLNAAVAATIVMWQMRR